MASLMVRFYKDNRSFWVSASVKVKIKERRGK